MSYNEVNAVAGHVLSQGSMQSNAQAPEGHLMAAVRQASEQAVKNHGKLAHIMRRVRGVDAPQESVANKPEAIPSTLEDHVRVLDRALDSSAALLNEAETLF